jgi:hypothetical protein
MPDALGFPANLTEELKTIFTTHLAGVDDDPKAVILERPLRHTDGNVAVGIYAMDWRPEQDSHLIGQDEPSIATYLLRVQVMIKHAEEQEGRRLFTTRSKIVRAILYRDPALRVAFQALQEDLLGTRERFMRFGVRNQSFLNNELRGTWVYLATTDLWVQTETVKL